MRHIFESQGRWRYHYRAIDSTGATIDFLLAAWRDATAAKRLFRQALSDPSHPQPRVINTDQARLYGGAAITAVKAEGTLRRHCRHRPVQYLNNILEERIVFNVKGNAYQLVVAVDFEKSMVWIKWISTHKDYDRIDVTEVERDK
jgi:transposase-like protein